MGGRMFKGGGQHEGEGRGKDRGETGRKGWY